MHFFKVVIVLLSYVASTLLPIQVYAQSTSTTVQPTCAPVTINCPVGATAHQDPKTCAASCLTPPSMQNAAAQAGKKNMVGVGIMLAAGAFCGYLAVTNCNLCVKLGALAPIAGAVNPAFLAVPGNACTMCTVAVAGVAIAAVAAVMLSKSKNKSDQAFQAVTTEGSSPQGGAVDPLSTPEYKTMVQAMKVAKDAGYQINTNGAGSITTPQGKVIPLSAFSSEASMKAAGLTAQEISAFNGMQASHVQAQRQQSAQQVSSATSQSNDTALVRGNNESPTPDTTSLQQSNDSTAATATPPARNADNQAKSQDSASIDPRVAEKYKPYMNRAPDSVEITGAGGRSNFEKSSSTIRGLSNTLYQED